jgi:putative protease
MANEALAAGMDAIQCGFADITNAEGLVQRHFTLLEMGATLTRVQAAGRRLYLTIDTPMHGGRETLWTDAVDQAVALGADAVVLSDVGLLAYVAHRHPSLRRHFLMPMPSVNISHIDFLAEAFGLTRAVLPAGFLVEEVVRLARGTRCEIEVTARATRFSRETAEAGRPTLDLLANAERLAEAGVAALRLDGAQPGGMIASVIEAIRAPLAGVAA